MIREFYFLHIKNKLIELSENVKVSGKLNILSQNIYCETFYCNLLNIVFDWKLKNLNTNINNYAAIDLIDHENNIVAQVSSQSNKQKIEDSLSKDIIKKYNSYTYYFICIVTANKKISTQDIKNPHKIKFDIDSNYIDVTKLLSIICKLDIDHLKNVYDLVTKELGNIDYKKISSDLAEIVSMIDVNIENSPTDLSILNEYQIDKKIVHNSLNDMKEFIHEKAEFYGYLNTIYRTYFEQGKNKERIVLSKVSSIYIKEKQKFNSSIDLYFKIFNEVEEYIKNSLNYNSEITEDNLELCIHIILVDAFIKCKIFESPEGYYYVNA